MQTLIKITFILILIFLAGALGAQDLGSLDEIRSYALKNSLSYRKALWDAVKESHDLDGLFTLDETSFSFDSDYDNSDEDWNASAEIDIPILDQISLSGSVYEDASQSVGLSFSPLSHTDDREQQDLLWQKATALAEEAAITTENSALSAALEWMSVTTELAIQEETVAVNEIIYRDEKVRYESDEATLDDVRDALLDWTEARSELSSLQTQLRQSESQLMTAMNINPELVPLVVLSSEELAGELEKLKTSIIPSEADSALSTDVLTSYLDMRSAEAELDDTRLFDPDLELSSGVYIGDSSKSWEASITFSFSLEDWQKEELLELQTDLDISRQEAFLAVQESRLSLQQALIALENTQQNRELAELEKDQTHDLYEEALFLYEQGEYSQAERDDAALSGRTADVNLFSALADEYLAWRDLMVYLP